MMGMLRRAGKILAKVFQPLVVVALLCLIGATLVWVMGERLSMRGIAPFRDDDIRALVTLVLGVLGITLLLVALLRGLVRWIRARRAARATPEREPTDAERECAALDQAFGKAVDVLTANWTGAGRGIYGLPWYLVIGASQSGKSSLIDHSDLRFPIDHEIAAEMGTLPPGPGRDMVSWRVAGNEAVMLDLDGRFFDQDREGDTVRSALWQRLLANLRKTRARRPINGVVLVADFVEFSAMTHLEREAYSAALRRDINLLVETLGTRMTVHIVFTKLDLLAGFPDYFEAISGAEREALFGFHFVHEGRHAPNWQDQFAAQYQEFTERLNLHLKKRIFTLKTATSRQEAFALYRTFIGMEEPLKAFLHDALSPDRFTTPPLVRGVYFASSRQENVPRNIFLETVGDRYAVAAPLYGTSQAASYPYFSMNILKKAVFPEAGLAGKNLRQAAIYRNRASLAAGLGVAVLLGGSLYWADRYAHNLDQAEEVRALTTQFTRQEDGADEDFAGVTLLTPLNTLRDATFTFRDYRDVGAVPGQVSLYQGDRIGPIVDRAYRDMLNTRFGPLLTRGVGERLRSVCPRDGDEALELLRVYRMMGQLDGRDRGVVEGYFAGMWQQGFEADAQTQNSLNAHLDHMLTSDPVAYPISAALVARSQADLGAVAPFQRVYSGLRALALAQLPDGLEFRTSAGTAFDIVYRADDQFEARQTRQDETLSQIAAGQGACAETAQTRFSTGPFEVPRFFTRQRYFDFFLPQHESIARVAADDLWVLGELETTEYSEEDYAAISDSIRDIYTDDYIRTWRQALNNMQVRPYDDIRDAVTSLAALSGPNNPMRRVAELVRDNTIIHEQDTVEMEAEAATLTELEFDPDREAALRINAAFAGIHRMLEDSPEGGVTNIVEIEEALIALDSYMRSVADAPRPSERALRLAIERAELQGDDPIYHLQRIAERAPAPFNEHLERVADESWRVIMSAATEEINRRWNDDIYGAYVRLIQGRYPFDRSSQTDLPLEDFVTFFEPGGILDSFYHEELLTFVEESTGAPREIDGYALEVDPDFAGQLRAAIEITRTLFDANGEVYAEFSVAPVSLSGNLRRAVLNFEGQLVSSSHGASQPITIVWPNILDGPVSSRIDLSPLSASGRSVGRQFDGPWSWLRLYDSAGRSNVANNSVDVTFSNANGQGATFRIRTESRVNLFFNSPLSGFDLPAFVRRPQG